MLDLKVVVFEILTAVAKLPFKKRKGYHQNLWEWLFLPKLDPIKHFIFFSLDVTLYEQEWTTCQTFIFILLLWNCLCDFIIFPWVVHLLLLISENSLYKINYHMFCKSFPSLLFVFCLWHFQLCEVFNLYVSDTSMFSLIASELMGYVQRSSHYKYIFLTFLTIILYFFLPFSFLFMFKILVHFYIGS